MSARYWVLVSDDLMDEYDPERLPEGFRFTGMTAPPLPPYALGHAAAGTWRQVQDDHADASLEGRQVELVLSRQELPETDDDGGKTPDGGKPAHPRRKRSPARTVITERRLLG